MSDLAEKTYGGGTPTTSNEAYWNGDIPWIQSSDVVDGKLLGVEPRKWITQDGLNNSAAQLIPGNSIAIITRVGVGKLAFMPYSYATSQDFLSLSKLNAEPLFTVYACYKKLQSELNAVQGTSIKGITKDELLAKNIMVPRYAEQQQIGAFFKQLDNLITLHQRKCVFLFGFFQAFISMIFTASTFSWEQRKAKELFVSTADKGYPELPVLSATQDRGMIRRDENSINIFHDKKNEAGYKRVLPGQFVIHLRSFQGGFAHSAIEGITSPAYTVFGFSEPEKHNSEYWKYVFTSKSFIRRLETVTYGIRDGRSISYEEFLTLDFVYPSKAEQTAIARYLDKLSNLITLHQRECISFTARAGRLILTANKKRNTSSWEQRKLGDVVKEITRNDPESEAPIMMITANNGFIEQSERYAFNNAGESLKKYILLKKGELAYNHGASKLRPYGSCFALTTAENARIPFVYHCFSAENQNAEFMSIELNGAEIENQLRKIVSSGARMDGLLNISFDEYTSVSVILPGTEEQDRIADFFRHLDNLITLHQRELEKLKNIKKSCLENMFV